MLVIMRIIKFEIITKFKSKVEGWFLVYIVIK